MTKKKVIDVLRHELVPKHILLTKKETEQLLDKYKIEMRKGVELCTQD